MKLGIVPLFIRPASPQENGRHERMHRTLKAQTSKPPANNRSEQQVRFDAFRRHYNEERPHEALGQRPPAEVYTPYDRAMPDRVEDPWYDADHQTRRVRGNGEIRWKGGFTFIGEALVDELIGIAELETGDHVVRFCGLDIGLAHARGCSPGSLHLVRGSATRVNRPLNLNCRYLCRSKMSTIIPVVPACSVIVRSTESIRSRVSLSRRRSRISSSRTRNSCCGNTSAVAPHPRPLPATRVRLRPWLRPPSGREGRRSALRPPRHDVYEGLLTEIFVVDAQAAWRCGDLQAAAAVACVDLFQRAQRRHGRAMPYR